MTVKEIIDKLSEYNLDAKFNIVVDGFDRPFEICFGYSVRCPYGCKFYEPVKVVEKGDTKWK